MGDPAFHTQQAVQRLRDEAGLDQKTAEGMVAVLVDVMDHLPTKTDLAELGQRIDGRFEAQNALFDAQDARFD